jgi:hypothetical protein
VQIKHSINGHMDYFRIFFYHTESKGEYAAQKVTLGTC